VKYRNNEGKERKRNLGERGNRKSGGGDKIRKEPPASPGEKKLLTNFCQTHWSRREEETLQANLPKRKGPKEK